LCSRDPGVEFVEHDTIPDVHSDRKVGTVEPAPPLENGSSLSKRWNTWKEQWFWSIAQMNSWGVRKDIQLNFKSGWFTSELLKTAGMGVDVYVMDTGVSLPSNIRRVFECKGVQLAAQGAGDRNTSRRALLTLDV
jgi:hypothetical protein